VLGSIAQLVDKIVVITIASATDRQAGMTSLLKSLGIPFDFHFGRDCRATSVDELIERGDYDAMSRSRTGRPGMTAGEIGCALSHRDVAKRIASGTDARVLVLEDDACVIEESLPHFADSVRTVPAEWNLAYFGYQAMNLSTPLDVRLKLMSYYPLRHFFGSKRHDPRTIRTIYRRPLNSHWKRAGSFNNAHAYALDQKAAAFIATSQPVIACESDVFLNHLVRYSGLEAICLAHPVFGQQPGIASTIGDRPSWRERE